MGVESRTWRTDRGDGMLAPAVTTVPRLHPRAGNGAAAGETRGRRSAPGTRAEVLSRAKRSKEAFPGAGKTKDAPQRTDDAPAAGAEGRRGNRAEMERDAQQEGRQAFGKTSPVRNNARRRGRVSCPKNASSDDRTAALRIEKRFRQSGDGLEGQAIRGERGFSSSTGNVRRKTPSATESTSHARRRRITAERAASKEYPSRAVQRSRTEREDDDAVGKEPGPRGEGESPRQQRECAEDAPGLRQSTVAVPQHCGACDKDIEI